MGVAKKVQFRGGTTTSHQSFTGAEREVTVDTTKKTLVVHDGITPGGVPLAKELETQNSLDLKVDKNEPITPNTNTKITYDSKGLILSGSNLEASDIPDLDASKITSGIIDSARLPSFVDDVIEYPNLASFPVDGEAGKIYIALDTNKTYRWSGSTFVYITSGAVVSVNGYTGIITLNKSDIGLSNVDNTSDVDKPISTATQDALDLKADKSTTYTKTELDNGQLDNRYYTETETNTALNLKVDNTVIESVNLLRADKYLASQNASNMIYNTEGKLSKVQYNNATDVDYEELTYNLDGKLTNVAHYVGSILKGNTILSYISGKLSSAIFTAV